MQRPCSVEGGFDERLHAALPELLRNLVVQCAAMPVFGWLWKAVSTGMGLVKRRCREDFGIQVRAGAWRAILVT